MLGSLITKPAKLGGSLLWNAVKSSGGRTVLGTGIGAAYGYGSSDRETLEGQLGDAALGATAGFIAGYAGLGLAGAALRGTGRMTGIPSMIAGAKNSVRTGKAIPFASNIKYNPATKKFHHVSSTFQSRRKRIQDYISGGKEGFRSSVPGTIAKGIGGATGMAMAYPLAAGMAGVGVLGAAIYSKTRPSPATVSQPDFRPGNLRQHPSASQTRFQNSAQGLTLALHQARHR